MMPPRIRFAESAAPRKTGTRSGRSNAGRLAAGAVLVALAACSGSSPPSPSVAVARSALARDTSPDVTTAQQTALEEANQTFAFDAYGALGASPTANVVFSPYSLSSALGVTFAGARTTTADQMAQTLEFTDLDPTTANSQADVPPAFDWLDLQLASRAQNATGDAGTPFALHVTNSVWAQIGMTFQQPFLETLATDYGAGIELTDFEANPDASRQSINGWVDGETDGTIQNLIPPNGIDSSTVMILVDAIYFDATWRTPFGAGQTAPGTFTRLDGTTVQASMMQQASSFGYAAGGGYQILEMPYQGSQVALDVVLPALGTNPATLTQSIFASLVGAINNHTVAVTLPKYRADGGSIDVSSTLSALGMPNAFTPGLADFSGIATGLYVSHVFHQAFIDVDEDGTQAAAATAVNFETLSAIIPDATVTVDHPFFFAIRDLPTNTILFMGEILDPTA